MTRPRVVVVGGGFAGCGASVGAVKAGAEVVLLERTDFVTGSGLRAGRMNYNGKIVAAEEAKAMGAGDVFEALESIVLHRVNIVDEENGYVYNTRLVEPTVRRMLEGLGVDLRLESRAIDVEKENGDIKAVVLHGGKKVEGDVFVDCSGNTGGVEVCAKYGGGCAMCVTHRCPTFGDRVSIATRAGAAEIMRYRPDGSPGTTEAAVSLHKPSIDPVLCSRLEKEGTIGIPLPKDLIDPNRTSRIGAVRSVRQLETLNLVDIGMAAKCVGNGGLTLEQLHRMPGLEKAIPDNPMNLGKGTKIGGVSMTPCEDTLLCRGFRNLFAGGSKAGPMGGIAEAITSGLLAGHNAVRAAVRKDLMVLPRKTAIGDFTAFVGEAMSIPGKLTKGYSLAHRDYFERMKRKGLYTNDIAAIHRRISDLGLTGILARKVV